MRINKVVLGIPSPKKVHPRGSKQCPRCGRTISATQEACFRCLTSADFKEPGAKISQELAKS